MNLTDELKRKVHRRKQVLQLFEHYRRISNIYKHVIVLNMHNSLAFFEKIMVSYIYFPHSFNLRLSYLTTKAFFILFFNYHYLGC